MGGGGGTGTDRVVSLRNQPIQSLLLAAAAAATEPGADADAAAVAAMQRQQQADMLDMGIVALTNVLQDDAENAQRLAQASKVGGSVDGMECTRFSVAAAAPFLCHHRWMVNRPTNPSHPPINATTQHPRPAVTALPIPVLLARLLHAGAPPPQQPSEPSEPSEPTKERVCIYMMALSVVCTADAGAQQQAGDAGACEALVGVLRGLLARERGGESGEEEDEEDEEEKALSALQGWRQGCVRVRVCLFGGRMVCVCVCMAARLTSSRCTLPPTSVESYSVQLLADLAAGHAGNQQRLREAGALELLVAALPRFFSQDALDAGKGSERRRLVVCVERWADVASSNTQRGGSWPWACWRRAAPRTRTASWRSGSRRPPCRCVRTFVGAEKDT